MENLTLEMGGWVGGGVCTGGVSNGDPVRMT